MYRQDLNALRLRCASLAREADERDDRVTDAFWACIAGGSEPLRELRERARASLSSDEFGDACVALEAYIRRFDAILERLDEHESRWSEIRDSAHVDLASRGFVLADEVLHPAVADLRRSLRDLDRGAPVLVRDDSSEESAPSRCHEFRVNLLAHGAPIAVTMRTPWDFDLEATALEATTRVARGLPHVRVRPENWLESLLRGLRVRHDVEVGERDFDSFFCVESESTAGARGVLSDAVRSALLVIARVDVPELTLRDGVASLRWRYSPTAVTLQAAARCLCELRRVSPPPLLRPR